MKKSIAMLLAIVMVLSLLPMSAFAVETGGKITFTTDFTNDMGVGDTFTVTATLSDNPGIASFANQLKWNPDVVEFKGFKTSYVEEDDEYVIDTYVFAQTGWAIEYNDENGTWTAARGDNKKRNGLLYTGVFEIIADEGALELGLTTTEFGQKFTFANDTQEDIMPALDFSAITGLTVGGKAVGPAIPEGAPFNAVTTTDGANVIAIEEVKEITIGDDYGTSYSGMLYKITIPEGAGGIKATFPISTNEMVFTKTDDMKEILGVSGYAADFEEYEGEITAAGSYNGIYFAYTESNGNTTVEIPALIEGSGWMGPYSHNLIREGDSEDGYYYAVAGPEYNENYSYNPICFFTFEYGTVSGGGEEAPENYSITIDPNMVGGTLTATDENGDPITEAAAGDVVYVTITPASGYTGTSYTINGELANDLLFQMPAEDVVLSATFTAVHTCTYEKEVVDAKYLKTEATCQSGAVYYKSCECGEFESGETAATFVSGDPVACVYGEDGTCKWCGAAEPVVTPGYTFATSADVSAENGGTAVVHVKITGHSDPNVKNYNAYDLTLTFDSDKLEYQGYDGAVKSDKGSVTVVGNTIHIVGCGADKGFGTEIAALTFKTKAEGNANVTISKVQVSDKKTAVDDNVPEASAKHAEDDTTADTTPAQSVIVVPYSVDKPDFISGNDNVVHGADYTFSYTDTTNYAYSELIVKVGGTAVETPIPDENGVYTIENVTGAVEITATQTPNTYNVTFDEKNTATVTGDNTATYRTPYIFTVTPSKDDMAIDTVKVTLADGTEVDYTINENGEYVIAGTDIAGAFKITVTEKAKMTTVTFSGIEATEIEGGLTQTAVIGQAFTFKLNKVEGFDYTVMVGETELTESEETEGQYTIPAELVVKGGVAVTIEKVDNTKPVVDVTEYISLDGKVMFLVTAKWRDKVLAYGKEGTMFWSDKYTVTGETEVGAYCWLVVSTAEMNTIELVEAAAEAAIVEAAEGTTATAISYDYDVNGTNIEDVNDAQLAYDMYNAAYMEFTDTLPMWKFLEADMETDGKLDTKDVAAIISYIVSGANA